MSEIPAARPATKSLHIADKSSLRAARAVVDADETVIDSRRLKYQGLLPCALKYALWATRPSGRVVIVDDGVRNPGPNAFEVPFNLVRLWTFKFLSRDTRLIDFDEKGRIVLERTTPVLAPGWSAGVVFSGQDKEIATLETCMDGLIRQPELSPENGGEIVVCGPQRDLGFLDRYPSVRYLEYETPPGARFLISEKKNALIRALRGPRNVILHARIVLEEQALSNVPREFDISSPNTTVGPRRTPYLSLVHSQLVWPGLMPTHSAFNMRHVTGGDPFELHGRGMLFVDGGAFYVTKPLHQDCPLNDAIAWEEAEDTEWCGRAFMQGYLIDMEPDSLAYSQSNKLGKVPPLGALTPLAGRAKWTARNFTNWARYLLNRS